MPEPSAAELLAGAVIPVLAKPGARQTGILGVRDGRLHVAIKAQPVDGEANEALLTFLRKQTGRRCELVSGHTSKRKLVRCTT